MKKQPDERCRFSERERQLYFFRIFQNTKAADKMEKGRDEVLGLLNKLSSAKTIAPIGARIETDAMKSDRLLSNLEFIVSRKIGDATG